jgi:two-component system phosphate regulon response regulator PhoB
MSKPTILVVEDEQDILDLLEFNLSQAGYEVKTAMDGLEALRLATKEKPDLVILDLMLPGLDGKEVCRKLRQNEATHQLPILMLTALASETDRIIGFEIGADDYLTKPFSPREVVLRVQAILRRMNEQDESTGPLKFGDLTIDPQRPSVEVNGNEISLTATEFKLLHHLATHSGKVQTREILLQMVWGYSYQGYARTVDTHIRRLRTKLGPMHECVETVRGIGYRFREPQ